MTSDAFVRLNVKLPSASHLKAKIGAVTRGMTLAEYVLLALENQARLESGACEVRAGDEGASAVGTD